MYNFEDDKCRDTTAPRILSKQILLQTKHIPPAQQQGWAVPEICCLRNAVIAPCEHNRCFHRIRKRIYNIPRIIARKIFNNRHFNHREERMFDNRVMMIKCSSHLSVLVIFTLFNADVGFCYTIYLILLIFIELSSSNLVLKLHKVWALT